MASKKKKATAKELTEIATGHQSYLQKIAANWANVSVKEIDSTEREMILYIQDQIRKMPPMTLDKKTEARFKAMEKEIKAIRKPGFDGSYTYIVDESKVLAVNESKWIAEYTTALTGEAVTQVTTKAINDLVKFGSYNGHSLQDWYTKMANDEAFKVMAVIKKGLSSGDSMASMIRAIQGTSDTGYTDGIMQITRNDAKGISRTFANGVANDAKMIFYEKNQDSISYLEFVATLDFRTSGTCSSLDGKKWKIPEQIDKVQTPPLHQNCRSVILPQTPLSEETTRPEANADFNRLAKENYNNKYPDKNYNDLSASTKQKYFYDAQKKFTADTGRPAYSQTSSKTTWSEWFERQSAADQKAWLGSTRYKLYKKANVPLKKFVNPVTDKNFTIAELKARDIESFKKIGQ